MVTKKQKKKQKGFHAVYRYIYIKDTRERGSGARRRGEVVEAGEDRTLRFAGLRLGRRVWK